MTIAAKYEKGVFKPLEDVMIEEGAIVEVYVPQDEKATPRSFATSVSPGCGRTATTSQTA